MSVFEEKPVGEMKYVRYINFPRWHSSKNAFDGERMTRVWFYICHEAGADIKNVKEKRESEMTRIIFIGNKYIGSDSFSLSY